MVSDRRIGWALLALAFACSDGEAEPLAENVYGPLGTVRPDATPAEVEAFERGLQVALRRFTASEGLGPQFNTVFCGGCHEKPVIGGSGPRYRNFLLTGQRLDEGAFIDTGRNGVQLTYEPGGRVRVPMSDRTNVITTRNPIPFFGVGLLAELSDEAILRNADPDDEDGDGISGRPNYDRGFVGRFGRKAQTVSIEGFIRGPLFNHLGITSNPLPQTLKEMLPVPSGTSALVRRNGAFATAVRAQAAAPDEPTEDEDGVPDPELSEQDLFDLVSFSMLLAAPLPEVRSAAAEAGAHRFTEVGCDGCHTPTLLGPRGRIQLYSDLLLHDMGPDLADGFEMKLASGSEFRTQPLWGVAATGPFLHDGRADTLHDAILWHGGEAEASKSAYAALESDAQAELQAFLMSLGGRTLASAGLLPPDAEIPSEGEWGAPLANADTARFEVGRRVFDRDFSERAGLGPVFNGDSCRACHFEPSIGGAGPNGVNVIRHGLRTEDGGFVALPEGTIAHRLAVDSSLRPPISEAANLFELRQTPSLFGLGLLESVAESDILANEDPTDADADGVRGVAHRLPDGRLGRFGWRADVPSLAEFVRDALSAEMGVTVPPQPPLTFGRGVDGDDVPDPEALPADVDALVFYLGTLAPPPSAEIDENLRNTGRSLFESIGCAACHIPRLGDTLTADAYTDLLLHDVQAPEHEGVPSFSATGRQYRTPPLWGLRASAPYWHDGRAETIESAIAEHTGEAAAAVDGYGQLGASDRETLLRFLGAL